ncbi:GMC family oxidoreductase N-terminal domain-containing protein [Methanobrevibacter sp. TMH8]|uniref:GMC family oxidoreductase N-terminal domain-containing protein n=1 Tax=Methanobrevibacter sp. TMH8 TaxID=2848611 RepID=UPI001CC9182F|nr:GMC family oxidoreductase N-terminal domain-containing protein [Methanobrevibacter sp. TMH8]MBZ9570311.1 GMC family oxidoreductase N-terminal domain-containing protein [Methanobrevibacter sp. TMH8]
MIIIIGSGAGGSIIAMELALSNIPVTLIEKGPSIDMKNAFKCYDESDKGIDLLKTSCTGGSTTVAAGNGVRVLEEELKELGVSISKELDEVEKLLSIHEMDNEHFGKGSQKFMEIADELNLNPIKMPKFIRDNDCIPCGNCAFGCPRDAKWTSVDFVKIAIENGAKFLDNTEVIDIPIKNEKVKGVTIKKSNNKEEFIPSDTVILSAGAINSGILLQKIGLNAGKKLFIDPFVTIGGILRNIGFNKEVQMNGVVIGENYILAPHYSQFVANELKKQGAKDSDIFSIMVKIPDDSYGQIKDGKVIKENSIKDIRFITEGSAVAGSILVKSGVDPNSIVSTNLRGAHPGGTAAIGEVVDTNLQTEINGLYVSDASVLPKSPGAPPILTILALSKRLSKYLIDKLF